MPRFFSAVLFVASLAVAASPVADGLPDALDGSRFSGATGEMGKGKDHDDTISFENGIFRSLDCERWGFGPAPYRVEEKGGAYYFTSTLLSPDRGTLEWAGKIVGDSATATFRWVHERWYWTIRREYWFKGEREIAPGRVLPR